MRPISTVMLVALFGSLVGCSGKGDGPAAKPDFTMSSVELGGEHDRHPKETDNKYLGKTLELSGRVHFVETRKDKKVAEENGLFVTISHQINCRFPESESVALSKLKEGDIVTIVGIYRVVEAKNYPYLDNCRLRPTTK